jgi:predicted flap endonuclease-1-like 5' DNA nuclease
MIYLIGHLAPWLILTAAFGALTGWAFVSQRRAPAERGLRRERDNLQRDLIALAWGEAGPGDGEDRGRAEAALRQQLEVRDARVAELERALAAARAQADEAAAQIAELERRIERADEDGRELARLQALEAARESRQLVDAEVAEIGPAPEETALQAWRLRYFEQRVRYLEGLTRAEPEAAEPAPAHALLAADWRAREAEARARFLETELRASPQTISPAPEQAAEPPFAANADVDMLLRWRLLYLERRAAHLQAQREAPQPAMAPDRDRWKWRARYLEARVRHFEQRFDEQTRVTAAHEAADDAAAPHRPQPERPRAKPPVLTAPRSGAPDDLSRIEGVSLMQQSTLNALGVFHFDQIAAWTPEHVAWVDDYLRLKGRIEEEEWVEQAEALTRELASA